MEVKILQDIFIEILRSELNETGLNDYVKSKITPDVIPALFELSKGHDLAHIVSSSLYKNGLLTDEEMILKFDEEEIMSIYRYEQMKYTYDQICGAFEENLIPYIPLKGSVIRPYYPEESMRTSCDIDILVKEDHLYSAIEALKRMGFKFEAQNYHDVSLFSPNDIHLELHFNIQENIDILDTILKDAWLYAVPTDGSRYKFSDEFFVFYIFAHISYHFIKGGCGIRSLMDVWVMENKMDNSYCRSQELLKKASIYRFATEISNLAEICFSGKSGNDFSDELLSYIFNGGVYGSIQNRVAISNTNNISLTYMLKKIFIPYKVIALEYPVLKRVPILVVFCWIRRTAKLFLRLVKRLFKQHKIGKRLSKKDIAKSIKMRNDLGLQALIHYEENDTKMYRRHSP